MRKINWIFSYRRRRNRRLGSLMLRQLSVAVFALSRSTVRGEILLPWYQKGKGGRGGWVGWGEGKGLAHKRLALSGSKREKKSIFKRTQSTYTWTPLLSTSSVCCMLPGWLIYNPPSTFFLSFCLLSLSLSLRPITITVLIYCCCYCSFSGLQKFDNFYSKNRVKKARVKLLGVELMFVWIPVH